MIILFLRFLLALLSPFSHNQYIYILRQRYHIWPNIACVLYNVWCEIIVAKRYTPLCVKTNSLPPTATRKTFYITVVGRQKQSQKWYIVVSFSYYYGSRIENAIPYNFMVRPSIILFELCIIIYPVVYLCFFYFNPIT